MLAYFVQFTNNLPISTLSRRLLPRSLYPLIRSPPCCHPLASTTSRQLFTTSKMPLKISQGQDEAAITAGVDALREKGWNLVDDKQLAKTYVFKTYTKVSVKEKPHFKKDMHHVIATRVKSANHHPTMISVRLTLFCCNLQ
ncbi:pterin-4-alpha-carbinolamine dehydratase [Pyrenophora seminiperda CCB06]|uniref:Pterin-4-alpha-carbinolamine dehydratase n=1 Tax=Pyrenophora seminiperda CCB06 TaxID=1302712 RepID=A0A3M7M015_9PLEO|nr:pterin-4-alpha-carbinolamine dehydratase [Pyrenophora seminiperda CCB06]